MRPGPPLASLSVDTLPEMPVTALASLALLCSPVCAQQGQPLKTAVDGTFAPHAMPKMSGGVEGFNVDLAEEIGKRLKRPVTVDAAHIPC